MLKTLVIAVALLTVNLTGYAQPHKAQEATRSQHPSQTGTFPAVVQQSNGAEFKPKATEDNNRDRQIGVHVLSTPDKDVFDKVAFWINCGLALIGVGGIGVAISTLLKVERQTAATEKAAGAAKDTLDAIKRQADLMEDTARKQLRAYICLSDSMIRVTRDRDIEARLKFKNVGQTPAYYIGSWVYPSLDEYPTTYDPGRPPEHLRVGNGILPPQGESIVEVPPLVGIPIAALERLSTQTFAFYVQGEIIYTDIYKVRHTLKFRLVFGGPAGVGTTPDGEARIGQLSMDQTGNEETSENPN